MKNKLSPSKDNDKALMVNRIARDAHAGLVKRANNVIIRVEKEKKEKKTRIKRKQNKNKRKNSCLIIQHFLFVAWVEHNGQVLSYNILISHGCKVH